MVNTEPTESSYGAYLRKKLKKNTWKQYWVTIQDNKLLFMKDNERILAGIIPLSGETKCRVLERKPLIARWSSRTPDLSKPTADSVKVRRNESCKFKVYTARGVHLFKTDCQLNCNKWIQAISQVVQDLCNSTTIRAIPKTFSQKANEKQKEPGQRGNQQRAKKCNFEYTVLLNDDEESQKAESKVLHVADNRHKMSRKRLVSKASFQKWLHFSHKPSRANYEVLTNE